MSGGHWNYLGHKLQDRAEYAGNVWGLLGAIEHELDYGISCDTCYECANIRVINALEAYFDTEATSVDNSLRLIRSSESECAKCKEWDKRKSTPRPPELHQSVSVQFVQDGKLYRGSAHEVQPGKEHEDDHE